MFIKLRSLVLCTLLPVVAAVLFLTIAPTRGVAQQLMATPQAAMSLQPAQVRYDAGDWQGALSELRHYILTYPDSPKLVEAHILMARILIDRQRYADALTYLQRLNAQQQNSTSRLLQALALQQLGGGESGDEDMLSQADKIIASLQPEMFTGRDQQLFYRCRATALVQQKQPLQALVVLHTALQADVTGDQQAIFAQIDEVLHGLTTDELAEAGFMFSATELNDAIVLYRARQALAGGDVAGAERLAASLIEKAHTSAARISAAGLLDQLYGQRWHRRAIGVVLPLSGRYEPFGKLVRQGIELAAEEQGKKEQFIFLDSHGDPRQGEQAVRELIDGYRVMAIIGPLTGAVAQQVAATANKAEVPLLTLAHRDNLPAQGAYIFRNCLTVEQQVQALAEYAIEVLGLNTYAILYPETASGKDFATRFSAAIESRGGDIEHKMSFVDQSTDFRRQLLLLKGEDPDAPPEEQEKQQEKEGLLQPGEVPADGSAAAAAGEQQPDWLPTVDFEALFIPAYADTIAMLAPQLVFYGVENVQLMGINGWNSTDLLEQAGRYTKGAIFSDGFYVGSSDPVVAAFVQRYQQHFGDKPSILEAQAYDCANILLQIMAQPGVDSSLTIAQHLHTLEGYNGVTGIHGFDANGEAERDVLLLQMRRRSLRQLPASGGMASPLPQLSDPAIFQPDHSTL